MPARTHTLARGIFKAMGLFGGQQVVAILCAVVRTKLVALWIGPAGVGLMGLYSSAVDMINTVSNLGIRSSSVRDISMAKASGRRELIARIVAIVRRWSWALGVVWAFIMLAFSPALSRFTFGDSSHVWDFMALSACVLIFAVTNCEQAIMQGTQKLKWLAKSSVLGMVTGLALSIPMYYFWRVDSIVPSIIVYSAAAGVFAWIFRNRDYDRDPVSLTPRQTIKGGAEFVKLGICITVSAFVVQFVSYAFMAYLNHRAGTATVGLYRAGDTLVNRYGALLFSAIGLEFYPRLAAVCGSRARLRVFVSQEANVALYVLVPVLVLFMLLRGLIVDLLYTGEFRAMIPFMSWCMLGTVLKGVSWCMSYVILAKGASKVYLVTECASAAICLALNITFYELWGLVGLGVSYALWYLLYLAMVWAVYRRVFGLKLHPSVVPHTVYALAAVGGAMWCCDNGLTAAAIVIAVATAAWSAIKIKKSVA